MQEQLIRFVTGRADDAALETHFDPAYSARLAVYRQSFRGRVVTVLQETLLAPVTQLFGASLVQETLAHYFATEPPTAADLSLALQDFPQFLRRSFTGEIKVLYGSMVEASLARWHLLVGPDPEPHAPRGVLKPCTLIAGTDGVLLHGAWLAAMDHEASPRIEAFYNQATKATDLLLIKTSSTDLLAVEVPANLRPLVQSLAQGVSLVQAVQTLTVDAAEAIADTELAAFIGALAEHAALYLGKGVTKDPLANQH